MTLEEKHAELQQTVENCETSFKQARRRQGRAELENEGAARDRRRAETILTVAKRQLATFQDYLDAGEEA